MTNCYCRKEYIGITIRDQKEVLANPVSELNKCVKLRKREKKLACFREQKTSEVIKMDLLIFLFLSVFFVERNQYKGYAVHGLFSGPWKIP